MTLQQAWERQAPEWKRLALLHNRLPIYRNWRQPAMDCLRGTRLSGLTIFFLGDLSWLPGMVLETDLQAMNRQYRGGGPFGWRTVFHNPKRIDMVPVFRETDVRGELPDKVRGPTLKPENADLFLEGLGYRVRLGSKAGLDGRLITMPRELDAEDSRAESIRVACHREWARRDYGGYMGAEMCFGLVAAELGLECSNLLVSKPLQNEISRSTPLCFVTQSLSAAVTAGQLLGDALGSESRTLYFDTMAEPEMLEKETANTIAIDDFFQ